MDFDRHGDMGFNEAIVSTIAVMFVLGLYLVFVASTAVSVFTPVEDFDVDALNVDVSDDWSLSESYLFEYLSITDIRGLSVELSIPFFDEDIRTFTVGKETDSLYSQSYVRVLEYENGRHVPVIVRVVAFG